MSAPYDPEKITYFAETDFRNQKTRFGIKSRDRSRHMYVIGKSGVGKSTLLENMAIQDIQNGEGLAVLDPHGSFAEKVLEYIPEHRIKDVIYFTPFDTEYPISFNVLEDVGADKRHLVVSGLMSTFKKIWVDAWSARMEYILTNTLLALLEYPGATLLAVNRMLSDKDFRKAVVDNISDGAVKAFWTEEFAKYTERMAAEAVPAIQNKVGQLTANPLIRNIIGQPKSSFDMRKVMDEQKILIVNLSKGRIGEQNTNLLGSMIITKMYLAAMSRAEVSEARAKALPPFYFYVDEFQSFANETFADILAEARKYKLALIIAHQYVAQMEEKVRDAVFGNVGTTISFRVGPLDAELLEKVFAPQFTQNDLINLGMAQIYLTLMINDIGSQAFSARTIPPLPRPQLSFRNDVIETSRSTNALDRATVEENIKAWFAQDVRPQRIVPVNLDASGTSGSAPASQQPYVAAPVNDMPRAQYVKKEWPKKEWSKKEYTPCPPVVQEAPIVQAAQKYTASPAYIKPNPITSSQTQAPKEVVSHNPFKKAFEREPIVARVIPESPDGPTPFVGEKPLVQSVAPVKHAERGPTEQNKNLLRDALQKATLVQNTNAETKQEKQIPSASLPDPTVQKPYIPPLPKVDLAPREISHEDLKKVLS
jgi:energy-coupling factor transporter ATP-binding protein EcfA2